MGRLSKLGLRGWSAVATIAASSTTVLIFLFGVVDVLDRSGHDSGSGSDAPAETTESVEDFATRALLTFFGADWGAYWRMLDPAVREVIPEGRFVRCEERAGAPANLLAQRFIGSWEASGIEMAGVPSTATGVRFFIRAEIPEGRTTESVTLTVTNDSDRIGLLPTQSQYDAYAEGRCPTPRLMTLKGS